MDGSDGYFNFSQPGPYERTYLLPQKICDHDNVGMIAGSDERWLYFMNSQLVQSPQFGFRADELFKALARHRGLASGLVSATLISGKTFKVTIQPPLGWRTANHDVRDCLVLAHMAGTRLSPYGGNRRPNENMGQPTNLDGIPLVVYEEKRVPGSRDPVRVRLTP